MLVLSSGSLVTVVAQLVSDQKNAGALLIGPTLALVVSALSYYSMTAQLQKKAVEAIDLQARWARLAKGYERLWEDMYAEDVLQRLNALEDSDPDPTRPAIDLPDDRKRMAKWEDHVARMLRVPLPA